MAKKLDRKALIKAHHDYYHAGVALPPNVSPLTDEAYDALVQDFLDKNPEARSWFFSLRGGYSTGGQVQLPNFMFSLDKMYGNRSEKDDRFLRRKIEALSAMSGGWPCRFTITPKIDGVALYVKRKTDLSLDWIATQGEDGVLGDLVPFSTHLTHFNFAGLADIFPQAQDFRAELALPKHSIVGKELEEGRLRQVVNGYLTAKSNVAAIGQCCIVALMPFNEDLTPDHYADNASFVSGRVCQQYHVTRTYESADNVMLALSQLFSWVRESFPFACDGLVIQPTHWPFEAVDVGQTPSWAMAYKERTEVVKTTVREVVFSVGRTQQVSAQVKFDPVLINGNRISQATAKSWQFLQYGSLNENDPVRPINTGAVIEVERGGDCIPNIVRVLEGAKEAATVPFAYELRGGVAFAVESSITQIVNDLLGWVEVSKYDGLGEATLTALCEYFEINGLADLLSLNIGDLDDFADDVKGYRSETLVRHLDGLFDGLNNLPLNVALAAYSPMRGVGKANAKKACEVFDLMPYWGEPLPKKALDVWAAHSISVAGQAIATHWLSLKTLMDACGLTIKPPVLGSKTFVLSNFRNAAFSQALIEASGGMLDEKAQVSQSTTVLLYAEGKSLTKLNAAKKWGVPTIAIDKAKLPDPVALWKQIEAIS